MVEMIPFEEMQRRKELELKKREQDERISKMKNLDTPLPTAKDGNPHRPKTLPIPTQAREIATLKKNLEEMRKELESTTQEREQLKQAVLYYQQNEAMKSEETYRQELLNLLGKININLNSVAQQIYESNRIAIGEMEELETADSNIMKEDTEYNQDEDYEDDEEESDGDYSDED